LKFIEREGELRQQEITKLFRLSETDERYKPLYDMYIEKHCHDDTVKDHLEELEEEKSLE